MDESRTVLVTGASRGLGLAIVQRLSGEGFKVVGTARGQSVGLCELIERHPGRVCFEPFDLAEISAIHSFAAELQLRHGRFHGLINNAALGRGGVLSTMHEFDIQSMMAVNLIAPMLLCKHVSRGMLLNRRGKIVNISSIAANTGFNGLAAYAATKAGILGLTRSLARELGKAGITVNAVSPGYLETGMTSELDAETLASIRRRSPSGRFATLKEVASAVSFLMSDSASGINGANIVVDAGATA